MPARPAFTTKLSLPVRLKHNNNTNAAPTSVPTSRAVSPRRAMSDHGKPGLVLRAHVIQVCTTPRRAAAAELTTAAGPQPRCKGQERHL
jgi:hypothetical protein